MIRVLTSLLAVVAAVLALVLKQPLLFAVAGVMVVISLISLIVFLRRRHRRQAIERYVRTPDPQDDLRALGILEIRPKGETASARTDLPAPEERAEAAPREERPAVAASEAAPRAEAEASGGDGTEGLVAAEGDLMSIGGEDMLIQVRELDPAAHISVEAVADGYDEGALAPALRSLRSALGAHTVCLLRKEEIAMRYHLIGVVSRSGYARSHGSFTARVPLMTADMVEAPMTVRNVHETDLPAQSLGYYCEPIAVRRVALAPVACEPSNGLCFLLADAKREDAFETPRDEAVMTRFAGVFGVLLDGGGAEAEAVAETVRPRREIVAEEMAQARAEGRPLTLALVYLDVSTGDEAGDAGAADDALRARLNEAVPGARVERFGELTYGVFHREPLADIEAWALGLQARLDDASLPGDVFVGVALLQDRHETPDDFKAEATAALYEAYETGTCTIIES
jgi:GGDEF domain-containing protein